LGQNGGSGRNGRYNTQTTGRQVFTQYVESGGINGASYVPRTRSERHRPFQLVQVPATRLTRTPVNFLTVVAGLATLAARVVRHSVVHIIGDNRSSLAWCQYECFHSTLSRTVSMTFMAIATICDIQISGATHIRGVRNFIPYRLSRASERGVSPDSVYQRLDLGEDIRLQYTASRFLKAVIGDATPPVVVRRSFSERLCPMGHNRRSC